MSSPPLSASSPSPARAVKASGAGTGALLAILVVAVNLRGAVVAVSPVLDEVRATTGLSAVGAGMLTTLPVLCFGAFASLAPRLGRRIGIEATLAAAMVLLTAGVLLRLVPSLGALFAGTVLLGAAIAVSNVLLPALVKRDVPLRVGLVTGMYITVMSTGATLAAGGTVPLQEATGIGWRPAIAVWALPAAVAAVLWLPHLRRGHRDIPETHPIRAVRGLWHDRVAWLVTGYMGLQSLGYYAGVAWLPTVFREHGISASSAGLLLAASSLISLVGSLLAPAVAARFRDQRAVVAATTVLVAIGFAGLTLAPASVPLLWMLLIGLGQGASIALALTIVGLRSPDGEHASELSSMAQGVGYLLAATGPFLLGLVHELTGGWTVPMAILLVLTVPQFVAGVGAGRNRLVRAAD